MTFIKIFFIIIIFQYIFGCVEKTTYSGKIITDDDLNLKILDKNSSVCFYNILKKKKMIIK